MKQSRSFPKEMLLPLTFGLVFALICGFASPVMARPVPSLPGFVTAGGSIANSDGTATFRGNATAFKTGAVGGIWTHVTASGDVVTGNVKYLYLRHVDGPSPDPPSAIPNEARLFGDATLNGASGYWVEVVVQDFGEPGTSDTYAIRLRNSDGIVIWDTGLTSPTPLSSGNIQIHPPNAGHPYVLN